MRPKFDVQHDG